MSASKRTSSKPAAGQLLLGLLFGIIFGFLLQKGGVGKYHILMGQLLLRDFTVLKVMMSAVIVGMLGIFTMHALGLVKLHLKSTRLWANIIGGLVFGAGFGFSAYCPGTNMTAFGQGNYDAIFVALGLVAGSYLFAEFSATIERSLKRWGNLGELMLPQLLGIRQAIFIPSFALVLAVCLFLLERFTIR